MVNIIMSSVSLKRNVNHNRLELLKISGSYVFPPLPSSWFYALKKVGQEELMRHVCYHSCDYQLEGLSVE